MHFGMKECPDSFSDHCDLDLVSRIGSLVHICIFPILFEVEIPNLVCGFLLGRRSGALLTSFLGFLYLEHISPLLQITYLKGVYARPIPLGAFVMLL